MSLPFLKFGSERLWTSLGPLEVEEILERWGRGTIDADSFDLDPEPTKISPRWQGTYEAADGGTYIEVHFSWDSSWFIAILLGFLVMGPFALLFLIPFAQGLSRMRQVLAERSHQDLLDVVRGVSAAQKRGRGTVVDPTSEGAAAHAPSRFAVRTTMDAATFRVRGRSSTTLLTVRRQGLTFERGSKVRLLDWDEFRSLHAAEGRIIFDLAEAPLRLETSGHSPADVDWLAKYLTARAQRWSPAPDDKAARAALSRLESERPRG